MITRGLGSRLMVTRGLGPFVHYFMPPDEPVMVFPDEVEFENIIPALEFKDVVT